MKIQNLVSEILPAAVVIAIVVVAAAEKAKERLAGIMDSLSPYSCLTSLSWWKQFCRVGCGNPLKGSSLGAQTR